VTTACSASRRPPTVCRRRRRLRPTGRRGPLCRAGLWRRAAVAGGGGDRR